MFEETLERVRQWYGFFIAGYVVMPEHVHLLMSEPERASLSRAIQMLKQVVSRKLHCSGRADRFWCSRYYDFNVWTEKKRIEKLKYIHRNPVKRGLCVDPAEWVGSSFHHYVTGEDGIVEIESAWTAKKREQMGILPKAVLRWGE